MSQDRVRVKVRVVIRVSVKQYSTALGAKFAALREFFSWLNADSTGPHTRESRRQRKPRI